MKIVIHQHRSLIEIKGQDRKGFLQGLITNDIHKASHDQLIYAAMLNAQGRFLYDFFIFEKGESLFLDCFDARRDEIIKKLKFYKLRSKVEIVKHDDLVVQSFEESDDLEQFRDPRHVNLGFRSYIDPVKQDDFEVISNTEYEIKRIANRIPEGELDLTYEKSIILEFNFDNLQAIDYQKGCYIGQELTARTHYKGQIRKKLVHVVIDDVKKIEKGQKFSCEGKSVGVVLSSIFYDDKLHALALVRLEDFSKKIDNLECEQHKTTLIA